MNNKPDIENCHSITEIVVEFPQIRVDEKMRLVAGDSNSNNPTELGVNWRARGQLICDAVQESSEDASWTKETIKTDLVRFRKKYIWLSAKAPSEAPLSYPKLLQLKDYWEEVAKCLKLWRADLGKPNDSSARSKRWLESKSNAAPWIAHIAEMILAKFSPWPDPFHLRPENDDARNLNSEKCLKQAVLPLFRELEKAPCSDMPNLVARFISCIRALIKAKPDWTNDAHGFPGDFLESWTFKVRTRDHSYIKGEIVGEPHSTFTSNSRLGFKEVEGRYDESECFCVWSGEIYCFITEDKDKRYKY
jgi:hypothetical protein